MANQNQQKQYTFINMKKCIGKNGNTYVGVTLEALVTGVSGLRTTQSGKNVINFNTPIHNRGKFIESMCGTAPVENAEGTCWARVSLWDSDPQRTGTATRFNNLMSKRNGTTVLMITGSIKVETQTGNDGREYVNVNITADDFFLLPDRKKNENADEHGAENANAANNSSAAPVQPSAPDIPTGTSSFVDIGDDEELPF